LEEAKLKLDEFTERVKNIAVKGGGLQPRWNLATDLPSMLTVSRSTALAASLRKESRAVTPGGLPESRPRVREIQLRDLERRGQLGQPISAAESPLPMPEELKALLEEATDG